MNVVDVEFEFVSKLLQVARLSSVISSKLFSRVKMVRFAMSFFFYTKICQVLPKRDKKRLEKHENHYKQDTFKCQLYFTCNVT